MIALLFDEALGKAANLQDERAVTAHLEVDFRSPVLLGEQLFVDAWCEPAQEAGRKRSVRGSLENGGGNVLAEAAGLWIVVNPPISKRANRGLMRPESGYGNRTKR